MKNYLVLLFPLIRYHSRWAELTWEDISYCLNRWRMRKGNRGFYGLEKVTSVDVGGWSTTECAPLSEDAEGLLNRFFESSRENGFELVLLNFPVTGLTEKDHARYNMVYRFCNEHGIRYADYNKTFYEGFDKETDFADPGHLNIGGAEKLSRDFCKRYCSWQKGKYYDGH